VRVRTRLYLFLTAADSRSLSALASVFSATSCLTMWHIQCAYDQTYLNIFIKNNYVVDKCLPECPLECNSTKFTYTFSANALLGDGYADYINSNKVLLSDFDTYPVTATQAVHSVASVKVFYESLAYTSFEETPQWTLVLCWRVWAEIGVYIWA
jgi:hypothetical protein